MNWATLRTLSFTVAPFVIPRLITYYRSAKTETTSQHVAIQPLPKVVWRSLNILFVAALCALVSTLPYFAPENIFSTTGSRLQTSNEVLFNRLASFRDGASLSDADQRLKTRLASLDARLLFFTYGPHVLTNCLFCKSEEPMSYLIYALPSIVLPYVLNLAAIGAATSSLIGDRWASRWRVVGMAWGIFIIMMDLYLHTAYDWKANARALRPEDYRLFFWNMRILRGLQIAGVNTILAGLLFLTGTNRLFVKPPSVAERTEAALKLLDQARAKINSLSIVKNAVVRDEALRRRTEAYWIREGKAMGEIMDEKEVVDGVRSALTSRVQVSQIEEDARKFADGILTWPIQDV